MIVWARHNNIHRVKFGKNDVHDAAQDSLAKSVKGLKSLI
jgi:hypothetical protein